MLLNLLLLGRGISFADRRHEAGIVWTQHLDHRIALAQLPDAVGDRESPFLLVPVDGERRVAVAVLRNLNLGCDSRDGLNDLGDAVHATVPFVIQGAGVHLQPRLDSGQASDDLFLPHFHRAAYGAFPGTGIEQRGINEILAPKKQSAALGSAESFAAAESVEVDAHARVELD